MLAAPLVNTKTKQPMGAHTPRVCVCGSDIRIAAASIWRVDLNAVLRCCYKLTAAAGMVSVRSKGGLDGRFSEDAEMSFKKFVEVMSELFTRSDVDDVMGRHGASGGESW